MKKKRKRKMKKAVGQKPIRLDMHILLSERTWKMGMRRDNYCIERQTGHAV